MKGDLQRTRFTFLWSPLDDTEPCPCSGGMAGHGVAPFNVSYSISDNPIWINSPYGYDINASVRWTRTAQDRPNFMEATHLNDPNWAVEWVSLAYEVPGSTGNVEVFLPDGRKETFIWNSGTSAFNRNFMSGAKLLQYGNFYRRIAADGSELKFEQRVIASGGTGARVYLTQAVDPDGNAVTVNYADTAGKIASVAGPGRSPIFFYFIGTKRLVQIKDSRDQTNRVATFNGSSGNLTSIVDPEGITSSFGYTGSNITQVTPRPTAPPSSPTPRIPMVSRSW